MTNRNWFGTAIVPTLLGLFLAFNVNCALAQSQKKGDGSLRVEYQYISTGDYTGEGFVATYWTTDSHIALLSGDYTFSDRWTVYAALPWVQKRFNAELPVPGLPDGDPHNPNDAFWVDYIPPDKRFVDDGNYHGGFQDFAFGLKYLAVDGPALTVSPYVGFGFPVDDYPFYAKAAIGANLWNIPLGVDLYYVPYFSDWHFRANIAYVFSEQPLDYNVDYWLAYFSVGYWFKPGFSMNVFLSAKYLRNGLVLPWDFTDDPTFGNYPEAFDTPEWYHHDRLLRHRFANLGVAFDYFFNERLKMSGSYFTGVWSEQTNEVDYAFTLSLTHYWDGGAGN